MMTTPSIRKTTTAATLATALCLACAPSFAAPQQDPAAPAVGVGIKSLSVAQQEYADVQARYRAGIAETPEVEHARAAVTIAEAAAALSQVELRVRAGVATNTDLDHAKSAFAITQAQTRLDESRSLYQRQQAMYAAGLLLSDELATTHLALTANELALRQAQRDESQNIADHQKALARAGLVPLHDAEVAANSLTAAQTVLTQAQTAYKTENLGYLKSRLQRLQARYNAGLIPQTEVTQAQADLDTATRQP